MAITRTYPAEWESIEGVDETIIYSIRERIGDRPELNRYYLLANSENMSRYIMEDKLTFNDNGYRFWPYHLSIDGQTVSSGVDVMRYKYMDFQRVPEETDLTDNTLDFWVETFYLSDFEIWTAFLSVDLTPFVKVASCITEYMEILKASVDLVPALRTSKQVRDQYYTSKRVRDSDTEYEQRISTSADPYKDLLGQLQKELDTLIDKCNKTPYMDGYRIE